MAEGRGNGAPRYVRALFEAGTIGGLSDEELLGRFTGRRDEVAELAFAVLVERHGPMVLRVCRAVLRDEHDAQDAFQATFLVLARRAGSLWVRDSLGPWLHGVALRASSCMKAAAARRRKHERRAAEASPPRDGGDELASALDEEIGRLPRLYRAPVVLCHLEGLSHDQAARLLGCPVGTVRSRLARGRQRLRDRLERRGLAPTAATRAAEAPPGTAVVIPVALVEAATRASIAFAAGPAAAVTVPATVITLAKGAIRTMWLAKMQ
jgi:RNA polymerase sigma factor (sigma-70 family)